MPLLFLGTERPGGTLLAADAASPVVNTLLIGNEILADDVEIVFHRAEALDGEDRFEFLQTWVLPEAFPDVVRMEAFRGPLLAKEDGSEESAAADSFLDRLHSPALLLVQSAAATNRLGELRQRLERIEPTEPRLALDAHAFRGLIAVEEQRFDDLMSSLTAIDTLRAELTTDDIPWSELTLLARAIHEDEARTDVMGHLGNILQLSNTKNLNWSLRPDGIRFRSFFDSIAGEARELEAGTLLQQMPEWTPVRHETREMRDEELPAPRWHFDGSEVHIERGRRMDLLYFQSPLTGNYQVQCEVVAPNYRDTAGLVAGFWSSASRHSFRYGDPTRLINTTTLDPILPKLNDWMRFRVRVENGIATTYWNERNLAERPANEHTDPWVAVRTYNGILGGVRNVRITGDPEIPATITLHSDLNSGCWFAVYDQTVGTHGDWQLPRTNEEGTEILAPRRTDEFGTWHESLLRYHRPVLEDGTIRYEFFYSPEEHNVHPSLGSRSWLLTPAGVVEHILTGMSSEETQDPQNAEVVDESQLETALPFRANDWNQLELRIENRQLTLVLNEIPVYQCGVEVGPREFFGLFHYADQTTLRVRNLTWTGNWPRELPEVKQQTLAWKPHESLENLDEFQEEIRFEFRSAGAFDERLKVGRPSGYDGFAFVPGRGVRMTPKIQEGWTNNYLETKTLLYGDFDIELDYEELETVHVGRGGLGIELWVLDESGTRISCSRLDRGVDEIISSAGIAIPLPEGNTHYGGTNITDECAAGTLKMVRRGSTVHSLIAADGSEWFTHIGSQELPNDFSGVRVQWRTPNMKNGQVSVIVSDVRIRSNSEAIRQQLDPRFSALTGYAASYLFSSIGKFGAPADRVFSAISEGNANGWRAVPSFHGEFDAEFKLTSGEVRLDSPLLIQFGPEADALQIRFEAKDPQGYRLSLLRETQEGSDTLAIADLSAMPRGLRLIRVQNTLFVAFTQLGYYQILGQTRIEDHQTDRLDLWNSAGERAGRWTAYTIRTPQRLE
ncbi:DUF1583 domain-containing protein [Rubinisphaera margarita]|uniref:DUF1583 domain-containing protein n=1 Tax=Rubinisphaera margarita TaxID=2909586 RepID=UPI001EE8F2D5|nr:DUF1583 domain-containing protein [Rubinisphaera margarita]MCG6155920.1 DUF1583 domain-containing protein [Rubinisphaera margarita]